MRAAVLSALAVGIAGSAAGQTAPTSARPRAFSFAVVVGPALSFGGIRATRADTGNLTAESKMGNGPSFGAAVEVPMLRNFGLHVGGMIGRHPRVLCFNGTSCSSSGSVTAIRANALLLARLKPRVPIFFGAGGAMTRLDPGPVTVVQDTVSVSETGFVGVIGYDFALDKKVGGRIGWWHYFLSASQDGLTAAYRAASPHDWLISIDARISFGL